MVLFPQGTADINAPPGSKEEDPTPTTTTKSADSAESEPKTETKDDTDADKKPEDESKDLFKENEKEVGESMDTECIDVKDAPDPDMPMDDSGKQKDVSPSEPKTPDKDDNETKKEDLSDEKGDNGKDNGSVKECDDSKAKEPCQPKKEGDVIEWEDEDDYLLHLQEILTRVHTAFYEMYEQSHLQAGEQKDPPKELPDLKNIIPYVRKKVLKGVNIVFSGMFPLNMPAHKSKAYIVAKALGANVHTDFVFKKSKSGDGEVTTHLVAAKAGTGKHKTASKAKGIKIVNGDWLWACNERWEWVSESLYVLPHKDFLGDSPEGADTPKPRNNKKRKGDRSESGQKSRKHLKMDKGQGSSSDDSEVFASSYNPRMAFSDEDIEFMDKEVDEILDDNDDSSESEDEREKRMRSQVLSKKYESDSDSDSIAGDLPRGWKIRRKSMSPQHKQDIEDAEQRAEGDNDSETENELERYEKNIAAFAPNESESESGESIGSVDDEIADAVEREFLNSLM